MNDGITVRKSLHWHVITIILLNAKVARGIFPPCYVVIYHHSFLFNYLIICDVQNLTSECKCTYIKVWYVCKDELLISFVMFYK